MSHFFAENKKLFVPEFNDGRTKQAFKNSTDINMILKKAQKTGSLAHAMKYDSAVYGEFENYDLLEAFDKLGRAQTIFNELPSEIRKDFDQDALKFAKFASDPENVDRLKELLPKIAEPGDFFPNPMKRTEAEAKVEPLPKDEKVTPEAVIPAVPEVPVEKPAGGVT